MPKATKKTRKSKKKNELIVVAPDFHKNKDQLKLFSGKLPRKAELPTVAEEGSFFPFNDHDVTGAELNEVTEKIQSIMIAQNKVIIRTIKEFNTIYDTFNALDKEYIQGILISLKAAEKANDEVKSSQNDITQIIEQQKQLIQVLKKFKDKIEKIEHFADVDEIFASYSSIQKDIRTVKTKVKAQEIVLEKIPVDIEDLGKTVLSNAQQVDNFEHSIQSDVHILSEQVKQKSCDFKNALVSNKNELLESNQIVTDLTRQLKVTRIISITSVVILCIFLILLMRGIL